MAIKNIIFDYGGVILNIDPSLTLKELQKMGVPNIESLPGKITERDLHNRFETGKITPQEYRKGLKEILDIPVTDEQIDRAWNALLLDMPEERIRLLEEIKKNYRIFLMSNTNQIHYEKYRADLEKQFGYKTFDALFEKAWFSHKLGVRKPDIEVFEMILKDGDIDPAETLFIDDSFENIEAANNAGIVGLHLREGIEIIDLFEDSRLTIDL